MKRLNILIHPSTWLRDFTDLRCFVTELVILLYESRNCRDSNDACFTDLLICNRWALNLFGRGRIVRAVGRRVSRLEGKH